MTMYRAQFEAAALIVDAEDSYARELGTHGAHPRSIGPVRYSIPAEMVAGVRVDLPEPLELMMVHNPSGYEMFFDLVRFPDGSKRREQLGPGTYVLRYESPDTGFYQRGEITNLAIPQPRGVSLPVDLMPGYGYPFPGPGTYATGRGPAIVQGTLFDAAGNGIPGVHILVTPPPVIRVPNNPVVNRPWPFSEYVTDEGGQWTLVIPRAADYPPPQPGIPPGNTVTVRFAFPASPPTDLANIPFGAGVPSSLNQAALRGTVLRAGGGPIPGATIAMSGEPDTTTTGTDGEWVHYFGLNQANAVVNVTATLPDGSKQTQNNMPVQARQTVWVPAFRF
jgi:hypothetical protein